MHDSELFEVLIGGWTEHEEGQALFRVGLRLEEPGRKQPLYGSSPPNAAWMQGSRIVVVYCVRHETTSAGSAIAICIYADRCIRLRTVLGSDKVRLRRSSP